MTQEPHESQSSSKVSAKSHSSYNTLTIVSFLIWPVGIVLAIIYLTKNTPLERKLGEHIIVVSIFGLIVAALAFYVLLPMLNAPI